MKKIILTIIILFFLTLTNCKEFGIQEEIIPNYFLIADASIEELGLYYNKDADNDNYGTLIDATVIAIGFNDKYIIAKQLPYNGEGINYYILPIKKGMNWRTKNGMIGPLSLNQFESKKRELNISDLTFTKKTEDLR